MEEAWYHNDFIRYIAIQHRLPSLRSLLSKQITTALISSDVDIITMFYSKVRRSLLKTYSASDHACISALLWRLLNK